MENLAGGDQRRVTIFPDGTLSELRIGGDGRLAVTLADGTVTTLERGPDPRFGMQAPVPRHLQVRTPGGLTHTRTTTRAVTLADPSDPLNLATLTEALTINGRVYTSVFEGGSRRLTSTSPEGRQASLTLDGQGRVLEAAVPGLHPVGFAFDIRGLLTSITQGGGVVAFGYDPGGHVSSVRDARGHVTAYEHDAAGRLTRQTRPDGGEARVTTTPAATSRRSRRRVARPTCPVTRSGISRKATRRRRSGPGAR